MNKHHSVRERIEKLRVYEIVSSWDDTEPTKYLRFADVHEAITTTPQVQQKEGIGDGWILVKKTFYNELLEIAKEKSHEPD